MPQKPHIEFAWVAIGQCLAMLGLLATTKVLSTSVSPAELGQFMLALTIVVAINQMLFGPYKLALGRFHAKTYKTDDASLFKAVTVQLRLKLALAALFLVMLVTFSLDQTRLSGETSMVFITGLFGVMTAWNSVTTLLFDIERRRLNATIFKAGEVWLRLLLCLVLTNYFFANAVYLALAYFAATLVFALPSILQSKAALVKAENINTAKKEQINKELWQFASPAIVFGIFTWINLSSDKWILAYFWGDHATGVYSVLYMIAYSPIVAATAIISLYITPLVYQKLDESANLEKINITETAAKIILWVSIAGACITILLGDRIILFFATPDYLEYTQLLPILFLSGGALMSGETIMIEMMGRHGTHKFIAIKSITALIGIILNLFAGFFFGITGIAIASLTFSIIYLIYVVILYKKDITHS